MYRISAIVNLMAAVVKVLLSWGIDISQPIAINVGPYLKRFLGELSKYDSQPFSSDDKAEHILEEMTVSSVDPVVFYYDGSFKGTSRIKKLINTMKAGQYLDKKIKRLLVILIDQSIEEELLSKVFYITLDENINHSFNLWEMLPTGEQLALVRDKISELPVGLTEETLFLKSAICFTYPYFKQKNDLLEYEALQRYIDNLVELNSQSKDSFGLSAQFVKEIYAYRKNGKKIPLLMLPNVNTVLLESESEYLFHDFKFVYMSNTLFNAIMEGMKHVIGPTRLKEILVEDGFLIKGAGKGFTSKMPYFDQYGRFRRTDALRFDLEKLQRPGKVDLITELGG